MADLYGLEYEDLAFILRIDPDDPVGFWRVDKDLPPEQRQTTLTLRVFRDLKDRALDAFCAAESQLPPEAEALCDARRTYTWTPTEDWDDCERHARNIIGEGAAWTAFEAELEAIGRGETRVAGGKHTAPDNASDNGQYSLPGLGQWYIVRCKRVSERS